MNKLTILFSTAIILSTTAVSSSIFYCPAFSELAGQIEGVWKLTKITNTQDGETTTFSGDDLWVTQHKIYAHGHVMWTQVSNNNTVCAHGFGTYQFVDDMLVESYITASASMEVFFSTSDNRDFKIEVDIEENEYSQTICNEDGTSCSTEYYIRVK